MNNAISPDIHDAHVNTMIKWIKWTSYYNQALSEVEVDINWPGGNKSFPPSYTIQHTSDSIVLRALELLSIDNSDPQPLFTIFKKISEEFNNVNERFCQVYLKTPLFSSAREDVIVALNLQCSAFNMINNTYAHMSSSTSEIKGILLEAIESIAKFSQELREKTDVILQKVKADEGEEIASFRSV